MVNDLKYSDITDADLKSWATGKRATRRLLRRKWNNAIDEQYPDADEAKKVKAKLYRELEAAMGERSTVKPQVGMGQKGKAFYDAMAELGLTSKRVPISNLEKDYPRIRVANPDPSIFSDDRGTMFSNTRVENSYNNYLRQITPDIKEIVIKNVNRIKRRIATRAADERAAKRSKLITIDKERFIGATDMSKATTRESIYDHWESVAPKYNKVKSTMKKLLSEAANTDVYKLMLEDVKKEEAKLQSATEKDIEETPIRFDSPDKDVLETGRRRQAQLLILQDLENEIKEKAENYKADLAKLTAKVEDANFEYLVKIDRVKVPYQVDAWDRMLDAIARYEAAEETVFQSTKTAVGGKVSADARTRLMESGGNVPAQNKNYAVAEMNEVLADDTIDDAPKDIEDNLREVSESLDPLLAIELIENKKLIALNEQSKDDLKEAIEELKAGAELEFISEADKWLKQLEDSYVLDRNEYILPSAVYRSKRGLALKIKKLPTALEDFTLDIGGVAEKKFEYSPSFAGLMGGEDILSVKTKAEWKDGITPAEDLNNLFDAIHILFTSQRYSFIRFARTQKGTQKTESPGRKEIERLKTKRSVEAQRRLDSLLNQRPSIPARTGRLISGISDSDKGVGKALSDFIEACNEYYVEPFLSGKTPIAYPKYMSGAGIKALSAIGQELGYESMMGAVSTRLSRTAGTRITQGTMNALSSFLTLIDEVVVVNDNTIKSAKNAAKALTKIFGREEDNLNTVAAILMEFIEQTRKEDDRERARDDFEGSTIQARAKAFRNKQVSAYPIFALYPFLENNQGLLTRTKPMRREYNKLIRTLTEVEDELPEVLTKLLKAHNEIRKAMGKEVITPKFRANHDGYDGLVDLMYKEQQIDLSHLEVENIVKAVDSHANIGKEYGITEEQVYLIKAHVR